MLPSRSPVAALVAHGVARAFANHWLTAIIMFQHQSPGSRARVERLRDGHQRHAEPVEAFQQRGEILTLLVSRSNFAMITV